jgi:hypothetical protein
MDGIRINTIVTHMERSIYLPDLGFEMQYLLTEDEYRNLSPKKLTEELESAIGRVFPLLQQQVSCYKLFNNSYGYCDDCPLSKERKICTLPKSYSQ